MRRMALVLALALIVGIALGVIGNQVLNAQQQPPKRTALLKKDLPGIGGKEALVEHVELAPGAVGGKHYHPGNVFVYILEGSAILEIEGKPPVTLKPGDTVYQPPKQVHDVKTAGNAPMKVLAIVIAEKGKPLAVPVK